MALSVFPKLRAHSSGQGRVTVRLANGGTRDLYCGVLGSRKAEAEYRRICSVLERNGGTYPGGDTDLAVVEALLRYVRHAAEYYGPNSNGLARVKRTVRTVREMFGPTPARDFGPKCLKAVVAKWVADGITRKSVNHMIGDVKRCWRWLVGEELLPAEAYHRLQAVEGLRRGRTAALDNPPVRPAIRGDVETALPFMPATVAAIVRLQLLTGARCGELVSMKMADVDRSGAVWIFSPQSHKGTWKGKAREILFGPAAQDILAPFLLRAGDEYVFSPARAESDRIAERSANRLTPRWPSHLKRNEEKRVPDRARPPGVKYTTPAIRQAVERACEAAIVPKFTPHRLRHLAALEIRTKFGTEHARATLGHTIAAMTEHYSRDVDRKLAGEVAAKVG